MTQKFGLKKNAHSTITQDVGLGAISTEREIKLTVAQKTTLFLTLGMMALVLALSVLPCPLWLTASVPIFGPWLTIGLIVLSGHGFTFYDLTKSKLREKGNLMVFFLLSCIAFIPIIHGAHPGLPRYPLEAYRLVLPSIAGGLAMTGIVWLVFRKADIIPSRLLIILPFLIIYVGGSLVMVNGLFDHANTRNYSLVVLSKHTSTVRGASPYLNVLSTDVSYEGDSSVVVPYDVFNDIKMNDTVCAQIHPGAIGMKWETVDRCTEKHDQ